jgi:hypothetical protein
MDPAEPLLETHWRDQRVRSYPNGHAVADTRLIVTDARRDLAQFKERASQGISDIRYQVAKTRDLLVQSWGWLRQAEVIASAIAMRSVL